MEKDVGLDYIRIIAMFLIFTCHFFQIIGFYSAAFWLNNGVQIFLVLSAYLMSRKTFSSVSSAMEFYKKRLLRIMLPMWIYLLFIVLALFAIRYPVSFKAVAVYLIGGAGFSTEGVLGLGHFWYISVLLICYLLVPILDWLLKKTVELFLIKKAIFILILCFTLLSFFLIVGYPEYGINISLFCIAYVFFRYTDEKVDWYNGAIKKLWLPTSILIAMRILLEKINISEMSIYGLYDAVFVNLSRCLLGMLVFSLLYKGLKKMGERHIINFLSDLSYEVYLTHQFILLAVYKYIPGVSSGGGYLLMILVSLILILINSAAVKWLSDNLMKMVYNVQLRRNKDR